MTPDDRLLLHAGARGRLVDPDAGRGHRSAGTAAELALPAVLGRAVDAAVGTAPRRPPAAGWPPSPA